MTCKKRTTLIEVVRQNKLRSSLAAYLAGCRPPPDADPKHPGGSFPNLAGFCRFLGCGLSEYDALRATDPASADYLCAVLEDEALNAAAPTSTLVSAYLKQRLGYGEKAGQDNGETGEIRLVFDHDISEDGA